MVRNLATIGGNLGTATPAGDLILAVAALDGKVKVRGPQGERESVVGRVSSSDRSRTRLRRTN